VQTWLQKKKKEQREKRKWKDDRTLIKSNHTYLNLIFCGPEWMEEKGTHRGVIATSKYPCSCRVCCTYGPMPKGIGSLWEHCQWEWLNTQ
jgi:hypothetical protein